MQNHIYRVIFGTALLIRCLEPSSVRASSFSVSGALTQDDSVPIFQFVLYEQNTITIQSIGYGGGRLLTGATIQPGGFDTVVGVFDQFGLLLLSNDDGPDSQNDPATGMAFDAGVSATLDAGSYFISVSQYDNLPIGPNLSDGFYELGNKQFTTSPYFTDGAACPQDRFRDTSNTASNCRTAGFAFNLINIDAFSYLELGEPPTAVLNMPSAPSAVSIEITRGAFPIQDIPEPRSFITVIATLAGMVLFRFLRSSAGALS